MSPPSLSTTVLGLASLVSVILDLADTQILALLGLLLFCLRKKRRQENAHNRDSASSFAAGENADRGGVFGSMFNNRNSAQPNNFNSSEKGLLKQHGGPAAASTPTMGGDTLYSHNKSAEGMGMGTGMASPTGLGIAGAAGAGAGAMAFAEGTGPGMRNSGVVLPRVKDENQSGEKWIETGAEVSVLWP